MAVHLVCHIVNLDIEYVPKSTMKAHALIDFVVEMTLIPEALEPTTKVCQIWADGAWEVRGSGIGIIL